MPDHSGLEQQQELTVYGVCATRRAPRLVLTHDPAIADRVSGQDRSQTVFHESSASCDYAKVFDEPVPAWRVVSANTEESRSEALRSNRGPLVGRHLELEQLRAVLCAYRTVHIEA